MSSPTDTSGPTVDEQVDRLLESLSSLCRQVPSDPAAADELADQIAIIEAQLCTKRNSDDISPEMKLRIDHALDRSGDTKANVPYGASRTT